MLGVTSGDEGNARYETGLTIQFSIARPGLERKIGANKERDNNIQRSQYNLSNYVV